MIRTRHTPGYDPQLASRFRSDRCRSWTTRRVNARQPVIRVAGEARLSSRELHLLEDGELTTDDDGWRELEAALERLISADRAPVGALGGPEW